MAAPKNGRIGAMIRAVGKKSSMAHNPGMEPHQTKSAFDKEMNASQINDENH